MAHYVKLRKDAYESRHVLNEQLDKCHCGQALDQSRPVADMRIEVAMEYIDCKECRKGLRKLYKELNKKEAI